jgi:hypothetical protein
MKNEKLLLFIGQYNTYVNKDWLCLVKEINDILDEVPQEEIDIDINLERVIDELALKTAWLYRRLGDKKRSDKIRKALGYNDSNFIN